jgi:predicted ATPase/DNA-binding CsgD family transcriptional regulator
VKGRSSRSGVVVSPREAEVFDLVGEHLTHGEIGGRLFISPRTVESHVASLRRKLGMIDHRSLVRLAVQSRTQPPVSADNTPSSNLPVRLTRLIGRTDDLDRARRLLAKHRLVTITAVGGSGKTRLAVAVGEAELLHRPAGVWLVDLTEVLNADDVPGIIAGSVGLPLVGGDATSQVIGFLAGKAALVILDNCEHVIDACAEFAEAFLAVAGETQLLATSREALDVEGEQIMNLASLSGVVTGGRGNLPTPLSSFVGRTAEIGAISTLLASERLVSLVGFGGAGKSRLAIEVARDLTDRFDGDVWFVDLVLVNEPVALADAFAAGAGLQATLDADPAEFLLTQLANRNALIVVDNCEHLINAVADLVGRLVRAAPDVVVLATSRLPLGVPGESIWHVQPLEIVTTASDLFENRARLVRPGFVIDDSNRAIVEQICARLDGIPLAIELATARLKTMTLQQIAEHLDDRFALLTTSDRAVEERHRSLHITMKWSYDLLEGPDRALLSALSVFSDGCTLDAAEAVGSDGVDGEVEVVASIDVLDSLGRLVDASLIAFDDTTGSARYRMLETVREFAADQLDHDEQHRLRHAHARHYSTVAARVDELYFGDHDASVTLGEQEVANLRSAMRWAYTNDEPRVGMSIATHVWWYLWSRTLNRESLRWGRTALELIDDDDDEVMFCAALVCVNAYNILDSESQALAEQRLRRGLATIQDPHVKSRALSALSATQMEVDPRAAESLLEQAWLAAPVSPRSISVLNNRLVVSWFTGTLVDGDAVLARLDEILALTADTPQTAVKIQAGVAAFAGRWDDVMRLTENYADFNDVIRRDLRVLRSEALGVLGHTDDAIAVIPQLDANDDATYVRGVHLVRAPIDLARGDLSAALQRLAVLGDMIDRDDRRLAITMQVAAFLAVAAHHLEQHETAATLFGFSAGERARLDIMLRPSVRPLNEQTQQTCRAVLGDQRFDELAELGVAKQWADLPVVIHDPTSTEL